ncbi:MAG: hypothetical protein B6I25_08645 [Planctomycetales bacterium 4572_13]|nr:MAG: hypothetical protein B6I25_08645 [Planctomycetales bacterium 4572_13]
MMLLCVTGGVFAAAIPGTAGVVTVQDGPNLEGHHYTINIHYEAFDGTDATDPMEVTPGKVQFAYILEYVDGNEPVTKYDIESINGIPIDGYASSSASDITVNGVNAGTISPYYVSKTEYIPGGNDVVRFTFFKRGVPSQFIGAGTRSAILVYTASEDSWMGKVLGYVVGSSLSASDKVLGPAPTLVPTKPRTPGYWKHQFGGKGKHKESDPQLTGYLTDIKNRSQVFATLAGDVEADRDTVLTTLKPDDSSIMLDKAKKHLLAMWLNIASGKIDYLLPMTFDPADFDTTATTVGEAIEQTESVILNAAATDAELENVKDMMDMLNNL